MRRTCVPGCLLVLVLAACPGPAAKTAFALRAYGTPADTSGGLVIVDHPWSIEAGGTVAGKGHVGIGLPLEKIEVACTNMPCDIRGDDTVAINAQPPPGVDHVDLVVSKYGYLPAKLTVQFIEFHYRTMLVLMQPEGP